MNYSGLFLYYTYIKNQTNMYYKVIKSNLSFNEAIDSFNNGNIIRLENRIFNPKDININNIRLYMNQIKSNNWEVIDIDSDMLDKLDNVRDMMHEINLNIDSRFYDEEKMDISYYWNLFENQFVISDDNLQYEFMKFYFDNLIVNKRSIESNKNHLTNN